MKRLFTLVIAMLLCLSFMSAAFAAKISEMTLEQLYEARDKIDKEIQRRLNSYAPWMSYGAGKYLPEFKLASGEEPKYDVFQINDDTDFYMCIKNAKDIDFATYIALLETMGYNINAERSIISFDAENENGYEVSVTNWGNSGTSVTLEIPRTKQK